MKPITIVVGLGRSGIGAANLLHSEGKEVVILEQSAERKFKELTANFQKKGVIVELDKPLEISSFKPWLNRVQSVVISPGIPWDHPTLNELRDQGITIQGEISLAWQRLKKIPWIGITGTNGKTTVTQMVNHILSENNRQTLMGGNIGNSATELAMSFQSIDDINPSWAIMELSSYQLETEPNISPKIGIWTTLTPDHLKRHKTLDAYFKIKHRLLKNSQVRIYNMDDECLMSHYSQLENGVWVSTKGERYSNLKADYWLNKQGLIMEKGTALFNKSALKVPGAHNLQNLLLATAAARQVGLSPKDIERAISSFKGVAHRLEKLGESNGIEVFNDSKATNYDSACMALKAIASPIVVIAGGQAKHGDPKEWLKLLEQNASSILLFGESKYELKSYIDNSRFKGEIFCFEGLEEATKKAIEIGLRSQVKSILLSPACASFDQYKDFEERGDHFRKLVMNNLLQKTLVP